MWVVVGEAWVLLGRLEAKGDGGEKQRARSDVVKVEREGRRMDGRRKRRWLCAEETVERGRSTQGPGIYVGQVSCFTAAGGEGKESESSWDARVVFGGRRRELGDRANAGEGEGTSPNEVPGAHIHGHRLSIDSRER